MTQTKFTTDILEDDIRALYGTSVLERLLWCHSRKYNAVGDKRISDEEYKKYHIVWATDDYAENGDGFRAKDSIQASRITGDYTTLVQPRSVKSDEVQKSRTQQKAEVFTPSWVCNLQNNLIDNAWFESHGKSKRQGGWFNEEISDNKWQANCANIFSEEDGDLWQEYVKDVRIEVSCGEAPYLVSRYDAVTGEMIEPINNRIGLLDRKLRVVNENCNEQSLWIEWATNALKATYGFEYQGDNLLLAREAVFLTTVRNFQEYFPDEKLSTKTLELWAYIISWNLFQMDGISYKVPFSGKVIIQGDWLVGQQIITEPDIPAYIRDWTKSKKAVDTFLKCLPPKKNK